MNPCDNLLRAAEKAPYKNALESDLGNTTYAALAGQALRVAAGLRRRGISAGDTVGVMLPNAVFPAAAYGVWANGSVLVPLNVLLRPREVRHVIKDSKLRVIITSAFSLASVLAALEGEDDRPAVLVAGEGAPGCERFETLLAEPPAKTPVARDAHHHVLTLYTSGTTGLPKGAMISAGNLAAQTSMMSASFAVTDDDRLLCTLPLFHAFGLNAILQTAIAHAGTIVLHPKFDIEACVRALATERITWFAGVPTMYAYILQYGAAMKIDFPELRVCVTGGSAMPVEVIDRFQDRFGVRIFEGYGLTETTVGVTTNRPDRWKSGTVGCAYDGVSIRITGDDGAELPAGQCGEIRVRGPNVMLGYHAQEEATRAVLSEGWLSTGDLGTLDAEGFLTIVGRKSDLIIKGGYNVYPREIEDVLAQYPGVSEAAVVGVTDTVLGESVRAVVATAPGIAVSEAALREHVAAHLAKYKHPSEYRFVNTLPKSPMGKVLKAELRA